MSLDCPAFQKDQVQGFVQRLPGVSVVRHIRDGESSTWEVDDNGRRRVLRLTSSRHRAYDQLVAELTFVDFLFQRGVRVAPPLAYDGQTVFDIPGPFPGHSLFGVVFDYCEGRHFEYVEVDERLLRLWGSAMGQLHQTSLDFSTTAEQRPQWHRDPVAACWPDESMSDVEISERHRLLTWLSREAPNPKQYGLVHGDFERTNFVIDGDRLNLFDFDDCCYHWFTWDIAVALWVFRNDSSSRRAQLLDWFLQGYQATRPVDHEGIANLSDLVRLRTLCLMALRRRQRPAQHADLLWIQKAIHWLSSDWTW